MSSSEDLPIRLAQLKLQLEDENPFVRRQAAYDLGKIRDQGSFDLLLSALHDPEDFVRKEVIKSMGFVDGQQALDYLFEVFNYGGNKTIEQVLLVFYRSGDANIVNRLFELLQRDLEHWVGHRIAVLIWKWGGQSVIEPSLLFLTDAYPPRRAWGVTIFGKFVDSTTLPILLEMLNDSAAEVRLQAVATLNAFQDERILPPFIELLKDPDRIVAYNVVNGLASLKDKRAVEPLIEVLKLKDLELLYLTVETLATLGDFKATEPLIGLLQSRDVMLRWLTIKALGVLGDSRALASLEFFRNDFTLSEEGETLLETAEKAIEMIREKPL